MYVQFDLDVLKPHQPSSSMLARSLYGIDGVKYVRIKIDEIDQHTTSVFITIKGTDNLTLEDITKKLEENNCALHSVDNVVVADKEFL